MKKITISELDFQVFQLVKEHPGELGFVLDCKNYTEYVNTYKGIGASDEDIELTENEFNLLKMYFKDKE